MLLDWWAWAEWVVASPGKSVLRNARTIQGNGSKRLDRLLAASSAPGRERLTLIRIFEELRAPGYEGGYADPARQRPTGMPAHPEELDYAQDLYFDRVSP